MGILGKITDKFSSTTIQDKNSNAFMHLQKQCESINIDTDVLMKSCETYVKLFNKKSKQPQNLANTKNNNKKAPLEILSLATLQSSQTLNNTSHLSRIYMEFSDAHRHIYEKQKDMIESLNAYILYLNESLDEFKKYQTTKNLYAKNAKNFVSYQNKLKKQNQAVTQEQINKVEIHYKNYTQSLNSLAEKMAELTSNRKEEERTKNFVHLIDNEIDFFQNAANELLRLRENIQRSDSTVGENRYSEKRSTNDYIDEIMSNKLELENFTVSQVPQSGANGNAKINHEGSESQLSSKENSYHELGLMDYNGNNYNYDYNVDGYYDDQYNVNGNMQQANGPSIMNGTTMYDGGSNPAPIGNSPFDDYLNPSNIKNSVENKANNKNTAKKDRSSIFSDGNIEFEDSVRITPTSTGSKRKSVINNENLANIPLNEKVYNTKELNPKYCKAIYPFNKSMDDELELEANDLVDITKKFDDGWATGINLRSGQEGFFPLNCLLEFYVTDKFAEYGGSKENSESYVYSTNN
ncbi:hypothetical protein BCR32DRAFT_295926 [Anaeromyces robustus]|uniref:SH3 domain-containing protein n=1 Tax=Anaeromyces robustus TaxID=1754192 RepID=A0A1Y1WUA2_9FUNG|nr:hypothetical protein BCR32DRAFT_295926 [Anaeromyces robustus]|eukprot:ORX76975.1 hypothetical protein BCR32DRAFT_295926 [Anaeromyces robustus]